MRTFKDISFEWKDYKFDLTISEDRFARVSGSFLGYEDGTIAKSAAAMALNAVVNNRRGSPEINSATFEKIMKETGSSRAAILDAHGDTFEKKWYYSDKRTEGPEDRMYGDWKYKIDKSEVTFNGEKISICQFKEIPGGFIFPAKEGIMEIHPLDYWIDKQEDMGYGALIFHSCNPDGHEPVVKGTPIFYVHGDIGLLGKYKTKILSPVGIDLK